MFHLCQEEGKIQVPAQSSQAGGAPSYSWELKKNFIGVQST